MRFFKLLTSLIQKLGIKQRSNKQLIAPNALPTINKPQTGSSSRRSKNHGNTPLPPWDPAAMAAPTEADKTRFYDLGLAETLLHGIYDLGFQYCTPIQAQILPQTLKSSDAIGKAQTGTGKTAAFLITLIDDFLKHPITESRRPAEPRGVIIAPTRELVTQIAADAKALCKHTGLSVVSLTGGADYKKQQQQLQHKPVDLVAATPGRLLDFMQRRHIHLDHVESLVLDEADRMLDMGFIPQVRRIVRATPDIEHRQTLFFSATFSPEIIRLTEQWTYEPVYIEIEPENLASETVEQKVYMVSNEEKFTVLLDILRNPENKRAIIFANRRDQTQKLFDRIVKAGFNAGILSGDIQQRIRSRTLEKFKSGEIKILVATDVAGRGLHVDGVSHVINYHLPDNPEDYVHRIGRTGRAGMSGISISLACEFESFQIPAIEELLGYKLRCELPPQ